MYYNLPMLRVYRQMTLENRCIYDIYLATNFMYYYHARYRQRRRNHNEGIVLLHC